TVAHSRREWAVRPARRRTMKGALILTTAALLAGIAHADPGDLTGDALKGRTLAQQECAQCHRVSSTALPPKLLHAGPAFGDIANSASITPTSLFVFLHSSHPPMP